METSLGRRFALKTMGIGMVTGAAGIAEMGAMATITLPPEPDSSACGWGQNSAADRCERAQLQPEAWLAAGDLEFLAQTRAEEVADEDLTSRHSQGSYGVPIVCRSARSAP
jgi:diadenosine tetraphosphatase ApaH/serine/threonine PP2A family protein phosphatase